MWNRETELREFKKLNLSVIASAYGYEIVKRKSTKSSVLMSNGADKIIISQKGQVYVYCSVHDPQSNGTVIDFVQQMEGRVSLGRVREILRPYLGTGYMANLERQNRGRYAPEIRSHQTDFKAVAERYSRFVPIDGKHPYLCDVRGIPAELLQSPRLYGRVRHCTRTGVVVFSHWGCPEGKGGKERSLVGYEIKGPSLNMYSKGGVKGLFMSVGMKGDQSLAIAESGLDALSYMAVHGEQGLRVASISGRMNSQQPELLRSAIERMQQGSRIIAAFDNDRGGDELTAQLSELVLSTGRKDLIFQEDRPRVRGHDWNKVLVDEQIKLGHLQSSNMKLGR